VEFSYNGAYSRFFGGDTLRQISPHRCSGGCGTKKLKIVSNFFKQTSEYERIAREYFLNDFFYKMSWFIERFKSELYDGVVNNQIKKGLLLSV